jgi:hypothetical protein
LAESFFFDFSFLDFFATKNHKTHKKVQFSFCGFCVFLWRKNCDAGLTHVEPNKKTTPIELVKVKTIQTRFDALARRAS